MAFSHLSRWRSSMSRGSPTISSSAARRSAAGSTFACTLISLLVACQFSNGNYPLTLSLTYQMPAAPTYPPRPCNLRRQFNLEDSHRYHRQERFSGPTVDGAPPIVVLGLPGAFRLLPKRLAGRCHHQACIAMVEIRSAPRCEVQAPSLFQLANP